MPKLKRARVLSAGHHGKGKPETISTEIRGWQAIAKFLGQPVAVAQRWAKDGMPVQRKGRSMTASTDQLSAWLGREAGGDPVHVAQEDDENLLKELRRGLEAARKK